jgi:putative peptidoglycan lipid II flippase
MQDTRTPVIAGIIIVVINIALGIALVDSLGHAGLAIALTVSTGIEALILFVVLRRRIGGLDESFGSWIGRVMIAAAVMATVAELVRPKLERATAVESVNHISHFLMLGYVTALLAGVYGLSALYLHVPEAERALAFGKRYLPGFLRF